MYTVQGLDQFDYESYMCMNDDFTQPLEFETLEDAYAWVDVKVPNGSDSSISDRYTIIAPDGKRFDAGCGKGQRKY